MTKLISPDHWLSNVSGKSCYNVKWTAGIQFPQLRREIDEAGKGPSFFSAKVPVGDPKSAQMMQDLKFRLVDTNIEFESHHLSPHKPKIECHVRFARPADEDQVTALSGSAFTLSRFHLDPQFDKALGDRIKAEWTRSFFKGKRGNALVVAEKAGQVLGFLLLLDLQQGLWVIDLVGVVNQHHGQGIGAALISFAAENCVGLQKLRVGTQIGNTGSIRFYQKLGFMFHEAKYVYHLHRN